MNYCPNCGNPLSSEDKFCASCGYSMESDTVAQQDQTDVMQQDMTEPVQPDQTGAYTYEYTGPEPSSSQYAQNHATDRKTLTDITKVFMIVGCVTFGWAILPLAWCIPMTVSYFHKVDRGEPISTGFKVCSLLFVNAIAGVLMFFTGEDQLLTSGFQAD